MRLARIRTLTNRLETISAELERLHTEADDTIADRSDDWQESDTGTAETERADQLGNANDYLTDALSEFTQLCQEGA